MSIKNMILPIPLSTANSAAFAGAYVLLSGAGGVTHPCIMLRIINDSNVDVTISYDGVNDHDFIPANTQLTLNFQTNSQPQNNVCSLAQGTRIYVKGAAGIGLVYLSGFYQPRGA